MTIQSDDTVDGTAVIAISESLLGMTGGTIDDVIPDDTMDGKATVEPFEEDGLVGKKFVFKDQPISEFGGQDGSLTIKRVDETYVVDGTLDMSDDDDDAEADPDSDIDTSEALSSGKVKVAFTFPGEIVEANGTIDKSTNTVTWEPEDPSVPLEMHAVGQAGSASSGLSPALLIGGAAVLVVAVAVVVLVLVRRRKPGSTAAPVEGSGADWSPAEQGGEAPAPGGTTLAPPAPDAPPTEPQQP